MKSPPNPFLPSDGSLEHIREELAHIDLDEVEAIIRSTDAETAAEMVVEYIMLKITGKVAGTEEKTS
jgi:hypothetical protein